MKKTILAIFTIILTLAIFGCGKTAGGDGGGGGGGETNYTPPDNMNITIVLFEDNHDKIHTVHWGAVTVSATVENNTTKYYFPVSDVGGTTGYEEGVVGSFRGNLRILGYAIPVNTTVNITYTNDNGTPTNIKYTTGPGRGTLGVEDLASGVEIKTTPRDNSADQFNIFVGWGANAGKGTFGSNPKYAWEPI